MVKRRKQAMLFNPGTLVEYQLDPNSFHAQLAVHGRELFRDADFEDLYKHTGLGRPSIPPSQMAILMLLQYEAGVSDGEAVERSGCDLRWAAALERLPGPPLCARTTMILFRARLALHDAVERMFDRSLEHARALGLLKTGKLKVLLDTRPVVGRGAVEDTFNLLARAMDRLLRTLAAREGTAVGVWAEVHHLQRYVRQPNTSLKGQLEIDWTDPSARRKALAEVVGDARLLLECADQVLAKWPPEGEGAPAERQALEEDVDLLRQILSQDIEERKSAAGSGGGGHQTPQAGGQSSHGASVPELKEGTAPDRIPSATDPDQRHGRKSASKKFNGHKKRVALDPDSELILDIQALAGNAGDAEGALQQVEAVERRTGQEVEFALGDSAFAGGATRREFADQGRVLHARQPPPATPTFGISKSAFHLLFEGEAVVAVTCPAGKTVTDGKKGSKGTVTFHFGKLCQRCPLRHVCVSAKRLSQGRSIQIHPEERLLQLAREFQQTAAGKELLSQRVKVEHALARLARLGTGQARYFGRKKTEFQLLTSAAVVNLRLTWNRTAGGSARPAPASAPAVPN